MGFLTSCRCLYLFVSWRIIAGTTTATTTTTTIALTAHPARPLRGERDPNCTWLVVASDSARSSPMHQQCIRVSSQTVKSMPFACTCIFFLAILTLEITRKLPISCTAVQIIDQRSSSPHGFPHLVSMLVLVCFLAHRRDDDSDDDNDDDSVDSTPSPTTPG